jgi:hypothetical protein
MKISNPIRAAVQVCPIIILGRSVHRPGVSSLPSKAIVSCFGFLLLFSLSGPDNRLRAQQLKSDKVASRQENAKTLSNGSSSSNVTRDESSWPKRIALLTARLGRRVGSAFFAREVKKASAQPRSASDGTESTTGETAPLATVAVGPIYSPTALNANTSGEVVVEVRINSEGSVVSAEAVSGVSLLVGGSKYAAGFWKFAPATDKKLTRTARLTFVYRLLPKNTPIDGLQMVFKPPYKMEVGRALPYDGRLP